MTKEEEILNLNKVVEKQRKQIAELTEQLNNYTIPPIQDDAVLAIEESYYKAIEDLQHESPKGNGVYAILSEDYGKLFLKIMEAVRKETPKAPALPEATTSALFDKFYDFFDDATERRFGGDFVDRNKLWDMFLPAIQEYVAGQLSGTVSYEDFCGAEKNFEIEYARLRDIISGRDDTVASKDAEIKALRDEVFKLKLSIDEKDKTIDKQLTVLAEITVEQMEAKQTGLPWVKASERLPDSEITFPLRVTGYTGGYFYDSGYCLGLIKENGFTCFSVLGKNIRPVEEVEWLDISAAVPDARQVLAEKDAEIAKLKQLVGAEIMHVTTEHNQAVENSIARQEAIDFAEWAWDEMNEMKLCVSDYEAKKSEWPCACWGIEEKGQETIYHTTQSLYDNVYIKQKQQEVNNADS